VHDSSFERLRREWRQRIDDRMLELVKLQNPSLLYDPIEYVVRAGGKRIRPMLLVLACRAVGGDVELSWDAAASIELLHNFTLVHDDIMDRDDTRRGCATVHTKWNPSVAILAGDGLFVLAYRALLRTESPHIKKIAEIFTDGTMAICEGQALDLAFETGGKVDLPAYLDMIERKTAKLLQMSCTIGALVGNGHAADVEALGQFGLNLGLAFQIQDDLLDVVADEGTLGKTHGSDLRQGKQTFLLVHALAHASADTRNRLLGLLSQSVWDSTRVHEFRDVLEKVGSLRAARTAVDTYLLSARNQLANLTLHDSTNHLLDLVDYVSHRNS